MASNIKTQQEILDKLRIEELNAMQIEAGEAISSQSEVLLLSPTGTGKTLAFLLPIIAQLDPEDPGVQALILAPSRELAIQIEQVIREMGSGYKANVVYGGRAVAKDKADLYHSPAILVGTPGRIADHIRRGTFHPRTVRTLVLDEFDKSLEIGFEDDMAEILAALPNLRKKILTSATREVEIPRFVGLKDPTLLDFLSEGVALLTVKTILSPDKDKLDILVKAICHLGNKPGIVFCNFKDSIRRISDHLSENNIEHGCFYGGMEQIDREMALVKFRNGTHQLLLATDLAARGIDVQEIGFILHYHLPMRAAEFTHRNGRTARMNSEGSAYVLQWEQEELPDFIREIEPEVEILQEAPAPEPSPWITLFISGGRKHKISKGDIAGLFFKQGKLKPDQVGNIELKQDCAYVAIPKSQAAKVIHLLDGSRLKNRKIRVKTT
jgi:superfamily II DNA/RNA helicase